MSIRDTVWALRRSLGISPTQKLFREIRRRGVKLDALDALEMFAHTGFLHTKDYHPLVGSLEAWELDPEKEPELRRNLPGATIKITDAFQEIRKVTRKYSLLVVDVPERCESDGQVYWEHYEVLPDVLRAATDSALLLINVRPGRNGGEFRKCPPFPDGLLQRRKEFFGTDHPEFIPITDMIPAYRRLLGANGFELEWYFSMPRVFSNCIHYLPMKIRKRTAQAPMH